MFSRTRRSVLLVDFENIIRPQDQSAIGSVANWTAWLEAGAFEPERRRRKFLSKRVYWNSHCEGNRPIFERERYDAFACPAAVKDKKSAADIWIALDAIDLANQYGRGLDEVILLSTDTDFVPVVNRLRDRKIAVVVMVNESNLSAGVYKLHADATIPLSEFERAVRFPVPPRGFFARLFASRHEEAAESATTPPLAERASPAIPTTVPAAPSPRAAPPTPSSKAPTATVTTPTFDLKHAAELLVTAATAHAGQLVGRTTVRNTLRGIPGFSTTGKNPWLGCGSYCRMLQQLAKLRNELIFQQQTRGGCSVRLRLQ